MENNNIWTNVNVDKEHKKISLICPMCKKEHRQSFSLFTSAFGEPTTWYGAITNCLECDSTIIIKDTIWDSELN